MGIIIRQSAISTILTYAGVAIGYVNLLILFPMYMSPDEVGLARIIQDAAMLMVPFAQLGIAQLTVRYFPEYRNKDYYPEFVSMVFFMLIFTLLSFSILFILFESSISEYFSAHSPLVSDYLGSILILILILSINQVMVAFSQSSLNIILPNFLKEVWLRAFTLIAIVLFSGSLITFNQFVIVLIASYGSNLLILTIYLLSNGFLKLSFKISHLRWPVIKPMLHYALITFLGASGILIVGKVDSLMVTGMLGLTENAIYTTAFYIAVLIELPKRAVAQIGMPIISRAFEQENLTEVEMIYKKSSLNNLIIGLLIFIGLWINLDGLYSLIPRTEIYSLGSIVVLIIGAGKLLDMAAGLNGEILVISKYYKVNVFLIVLLAVLTIGTNYYLIPIYGLMGAAIGSTIALSLFNLSKYIFLYAKLGIQPFGLGTIKVILLGVVILLIGLYLPTLANTYLDILYRSFIVSIIYGLVIYGFRVSPDINELINNFIGRRK